MSSGLDAEAISDWFPPSEPLFQSLMVDVMSENRQERENFNGVLE